MPHERLPGLRALASHYSLLSKNIPGFAAGCATGSCNLRRGGQRPRLAANPRAHQC